MRTRSGFHIVSILISPVIILLFTGQDIPSRVSRVERGLLPVVRIEGAGTWTILDRMKEYNIPGVSVAVFSDNAVQWSKGYGVMDNETRTPVDENTLFIAGSVSKPVAVAGALRLVQDGKLSLDDNINTSLTSWKVPENEFTEQQPVTLRLLASHNAGVTVHGFPGYVAGTTVPSITQILNGEPPANTPPIRVNVVPGTIWRYAGGGTTIMQLAMIEVTGKPFPDIMQETIIGPIGMTSSSYDQNLTSDWLAKAASGHKSNGSVIPGKRNIYPEMGAAGLWTTPTDLCRFAIEIGKAARGEKNDVFSQEFASLMVTKRLSTGGEYDMALGFFLEDRNGAIYYQHGGQDEGFIASLIANREKGYGAAIMTNSDGRSGQLISEILRSIAVEYGWDNYVPEPVKPITLAVEKLEAHAGKYKLGSDELLEVEVRDGQLFGHTTTEPESRLWPVAENSFIIQERPLTISFTPGGVEIAVKGMRAPMKGARVGMDEEVPLGLLNAGRIEEAMNAYRLLHVNSPDDQAVNERRLNSLGYSRMAEGKLEQAIAIFKLNTEFYPGSWNTYDSLGEAYAESGETQLAIRNYERSIELNPKNTNGIEILKKLRGQ